MKLRLGVIGHGRQWESRYQPALHLNRERFQLTAVFHSVGVLAETTAASFGAAKCDGVEQVVSRSDVDAVLLLENDWYGLAPVFSACENGKATLCGSELLLSTASADALRNRVRASGISYMQELSRRLAPATLRLKELIATKLGSPQLIFCHHRMREKIKLRSSNEFALLAHREMMEQVDWVQYIVGKSPSWVQALSHDVTPSDSKQSGQSSDEPSGEETNLSSSTIDWFAKSDYQAISLGFSTDGQATNGSDMDGRGDTTDPRVSKQIVAQVSCGSYIPNNWQEASQFRTPAAIQVRCEHGVAFLDLPSSLVWFDSAGRHQESLDSELPVGQQMLAQFHRAVTSLVQRPGGLEEVCNALAIIDIAGESSEVGRRRLLNF